MRRIGLVVAGLVACVAASLSSQGAEAQATEGFALNRFQPAEHGSDWFAGESLDLRGDPRPALGLTLDWAHKPLVLYDAQGDEIAAIVSDQLYAHVGGALILLDSIRIGLNVPIALVQTSEPGTSGGVTLSSNEGAALGDARVGLDLRLAGEYGGAATLALGVQTFLPTGDRESFTGDGALRLAPRLMLAGDLGILAYSLRVAFNYRAQKDDLATVPTGNELQFVASMGLRVAGAKLVIGPELWGSTVIEGGAAFEQETTPFELVFGGHYRAGDVILGLGVGPGLTRGLGAPQVRVLASLAWFPAVEQEPEAEPEPDVAPSDRDGDGIVDARDACPDEKGVRSKNRKKNGCPPDRDGDGIHDAIDACPDTPGVESDDPDENGCPPDRDGDGVYDDDDACPDTPGVKSDDPDKNGCPGDRDGDGIVDPEDACPDAPGEANEDREKHGCPKARIEQGQIKILEMIQFKTDSAVILKESEPIMEAVRAIMDEHDEITRVSIEGHTDDVGKPKYNLKLSAKRAAAVVKWLVKHGIAKQRLTSQGFGLERPLEDNDSEAGREKNRRVEFHIREMDGKPVGEGGGKAATEE